MKKIIASFLIAFLVLGTTHAQTLSFPEAEEAFESVFNIFFDREPNISDHSKFQPEVNILKFESSKSQLLIAMKSTKLDSSVYLPVAMSVRRTLDEYIATDIKIQIVKSNMWAFLCVYKNVEDYESNNIDFTCIKGKLEVDINMTLENIKIAKSTLIDAMFKTSQNLNQNKELTMTRSI